MMHSTLAASASVAGSFDRHCAALDQSIPLPMSARTTKFTTHIDEPEVQDKIEQRIHRGTSRKIPAGARPSPNELAKAAQRDWLVKHSPISDASNTPPLTHNSSSDSISTLASSEAHYHFKPLPPLPFVGVVTKLLSKSTTLPMPFYAPRPTKVTRASIAFLEDQAAKMVEDKEFFDLEAAWGLVNDEEEHFMEVGADLKRRGAVVKRASNLLNFRYSAVQVQF